MAKRGRQPSTSATKKTCSAGLMIDEQHTHNPFDGHAGLLRLGDLEPDARRPGQEPQPMGTDGTHAGGDGGYDRRPGHCSGRSVGPAAASHFASSADASAQGSPRRHGNTPFLVHGGHVRPSRHHPSLCRLIEFSTPNTWAFRTWWSEPGLGSCPRGSGHRLLDRPGDPDASTNWARTPSSRICIA